MVLERIVPVSTLDVPSVGAPIPSNFAAVPFWLRPHLLSLDAPIVAAAWQILFAFAINGTVRLLNTLTLFLTVWVIYVVDRLLDSAPPDVMLRATRHVYYKQHRRTFIVAAIVAIFVLLFTMARIATDLLQAGIGVGLLVLVYFALVHGTKSRSMPKEALVGFLFAVGTVLPVWVRSSPYLNSTQKNAMLVSTSLFAIVCCLNCIAIEYWESHTEGRVAEANWLVRSVGKRLALAAFALALGAAAFTAYSPLPSIALALSIGALLLALVDRSSKALTADAQRVLADVCLLSPIVVLTVLLSR